MTPTERAKNIASILNYDWSDKDSHCLAVISEIEEAEREAYHKGREKMYLYYESLVGDWYREGKEEGFNAAKETAKEIAIPNHKCDPPGCNDECKEAWHIADRISKMEPEK